ncbi:MAG: YXWGXW repeat-containing protein [Candidatus Acidiferrales bacterium]
MHRLVIRTLLLLAFSALIASVPTHAQVAVGISVGFAPPAIPVYTQPVCPGEGYIWTPGYWAWDSDFDDYYWVPGTWVEPPEVGFLWTPGYWAWDGSAFVFYDGYWGPQVGFYGDVDYGFGYFGDGYVGGRWDHDHFYYNRAVSNVNVTIVHNVYNERIRNVRVDRVSYNGGRGGITARPTAQQQDFARQRHIAPVAAQSRQMQAARGNRDLRASVNHGKPPIAATARPGEFKGKVVKAEAAGAPYSRPATRNAANDRGKANTPAENNRSANAREASRGQNRPNVNRAGGNAQANRERAPAANTRNSKLNQNYQQQQQKPVERQPQQRQIRQPQQRQVRQPQQRQVRQPQQRQVRQPQQRQVRQPQQRQEPQSRSAPAERKGGGR